MLSVEQIIKCFKNWEIPEWTLYTDGIGYTPKEEENSVYSVYFEDGKVSNGIAHYFLFLDHVVQAINRDSKYTVEDSGCSIDICEKGANVTEELFDYIEDYDSIHLAREEAIKYLFER